MKDLFSHRHMGFGYTPFSHERLLESEAARAALDAMEARLRTSFDDATRQEIERDPLAVAFRLADRQVIFTADGLKQRAFVGYGYYGGYGRRGEGTLLARAILAAQASGSVVREYTEPSERTGYDVAVSDGQVQITLIERQHGGKQGPKTHPPLVFGDAFATRLLAWATEVLAAHPVPETSHEEQIILDWIEAREIRYTPDVEVSAGVSRELTITQCAKDIGRKRPEVAKTCRAMAAKGLVHVFTGRPERLSMCRLGQVVLAEAGYKSRERFSMPQPVESPHANDVSVVGRRWMVLPVVNQLGECAQVVGRLMPSEYPEAAIGKLLERHAKETEMHWDVHPDVPYTVLRH